MKIIVNTAVVGLLAALVAGCATGLTTNGREYDGPHCGDKTATINHRGSIYQRPRSVSICPGYTLTLNLVPARDRTTSHTRAGSANAGASWLNRSNEHRHKIVVEIPRATDDEEKNREGPCGERTCEYKYDIVLDGKGELDPRVRVTY